MQAEPFVAIDATRILVADDDPILREFAVVHLATPNTTVETAADGVAALAMMQSSAPDIALIDLDMPRMDGFELIERLRRDPVLAHLPVVVVTGREDTLAIDRAFSVGATAFTVKPLNWRLLSYQLAYVLRASRSESELREAHERVARADAFKSNLLRVVQHEFNTPFNAILGFGKLIEAHSQDAAARSHAAQILSAASGLKGILDRMHLAARAMAGSIELNTGPFGAADLLKAAVRSALAGALVPDGLRVVDRTGNCEITADWKLLVAALAPLVKNALGHGAPPVDVSASLPGDGTVALRVRDSGPGLSQARLASVLDPFVQGEGALTRQVEGVGLGLSISAALVELHNGCLDLSNAPGGGLEATLSLPLQTAKHAVRCLRA
jgi:two-component system, sensor histidine kinase and response regulator